jgi:hypothetical protein
MDSKDRDFVNRIFTSGVVNSIESNDIQDIVDKIIKIHE